MLLKSRASLTYSRACFLPGRAKDLLASRYIIQYIHTQYIYSGTVYSYIYKRMYVHARAVECAATTVFMIWQLAGLRAWLLVRLKGVVAVCFVYSQV